MKYLITFCGTLLPILTFAQIGMNNDFDLFLSEFGLYSTLSCDCNSNEEKVIENWNNLKGYFFDNTSIYNECSGTEQTIEEYFTKYIPYIRKTRCNTNFVYSAQGINKIEGRKFKAVVRRKANFNGRDLSNMLYSITFLYIEGNDPDPSIKIVKIEKGEGIKEVKRQSNALCSPPRQKINPAFPIILICAGGASIGGSFYYKRQSDKLYANYKSTYPSTNSEELYNSANKNNHNRLILNYVGIGVTAIGITILTKKLLNRRKYEKYSNVNIEFNSESLAFTYKF